MPFLVLGQKRDSLLERAQNFYDWEADGYKINQCLDENRKEIPGLKYIYSREHGNGLLKNNSILLPPIFKYGTIISKRYYVINRPNGGVYDIEKEEWCILPIQSRVEYLSHHNFLVHHQNSIWKIVNAANKKTVGHYNLEYDSKHACILGSPKQSMTTHDGNKDNFILKYGIYDKKTGEISVPLEYDELRSLEEFGIDSNIFIARKGAVYTLINKCGESILGIYDEIAVKNNRLLTRNGLEISFFDKHLKLLYLVRNTAESLTLQMHYPTRYKYVFTESGKKFKTIKEIGHKNWIAKSKNKYGVIAIIDKDIQVLLSAKFDTIFQVKDYLVTRRNGKFGLLKKVRGKSNRWTYFTFFDCKYNSIALTSIFPWENATYPPLAKKNKRYFTVTNQNIWRSPLKNEIVEIEGDSVVQILPQLFVCKTDDECYLKSIGHEGISFNMGPYSTIELIDKKQYGNIRSSFSYKNYSGGEELFFKVTKKNGLVGVIDDIGKTVVEPIFEDILYIEALGFFDPNGYHNNKRGSRRYCAIVLNNNKQGLFDLKTKKLLIPCKYDQLVSETNFHLNYNNTSASYLLFKDTNCYYLSDITKYELLQPVSLAVSNFDDEFTQKFKFNDCATVKTRNEKMGLFKNNKMLLPPIFQEISALDSIHFTLKIHGYVGVFNSSSLKLTVPVIYDKINAITSSALLVIKFGKYGLIDKNNLTLAECKWEYIQRIDKKTYDVGNSEFDNLFMLSSTQNKSVVFDVVQKKQLFPTVEGYTAVELAKSEAKKMYIISKGQKQNIAYSNKKPLLKNWVESISYSKKNKIYYLRNKGLWGFADTTGKILIEPFYKWIRDNQSFKLLYRKGKYLLVHLNNGQLKVQEFDNGFYYNYDYMLFKKGNKYAIQRSSENEPQQLIDLNYDFLELFGDRQFKVKLNKKFGVVDTDNKVIVPLIYDSIYTVLVGGAPFTIAKTHNQLAVYGKDSLYFIVEGNQIEYLNEFNNRNFYYDTKFEDLFKFKTHEGWGIINSKGEVFIKPEFADIVFQKHNLAVVKQNGKYGLFSLVENKLVLPCAYKHIYPLEASLKSEHHFLLEKNGDYFATGYKIDKPLELTKFYDTVK